MSTTTARQARLPIWRDANRLLVEIERAVRRFPRYHKYALGTDLRRQGMSVCRCIVRAAAAAGDQRERDRHADRHRTHQRDEEDRDGHVGRAQSAGRIMRITPRPPPGCLNVEAAVSAALGRSAGQPFGHKLPVSLTRAPA